MGQKSRGRDRVGCSKRQAGAPIHTVMSSIVVAGSRHAVEMDVRRRVTSAARTRTMTSFPAMDHVVEMPAQRLAASAARLEISPSGIQLAMKPSAGVQAPCARTASAQTQTTTNSHATAHAAGMRVLRQAASAVNLGGSKNGILLATTQNAGAPYTGAPTTRQPSVC